MMRVFVVDNDCDQADSLGMLLRLAQCEVRVFYNAFSCLMAAALTPPDLLLADLGMPGMNGIELARNVRQCPDLDLTVLAALTGYADDGHREAALAAGFDEYLVKPVPAETLYELLARIADQTDACRDAIDECYRYVTAQKA